MSKVAIIKTKPETIFSDYHKLMNLVDYQSIIDKSVDTALKVNISWHFFFPGASTTPWQLEGVIKTLLTDGYQKDLIHACHNRTVVIDSKFGEQENKQKFVVDKYGLRNIHLYEDDQEWVNIYDAIEDTVNDLIVLPKVYPHGFKIPKRFIGENIIHLPTVKTHVFTTTTGAMKNAFGGLLNERRHWTHSVIHETLVDLLLIQKKIHKGIFAVMDGTFSGDGPGPRCMTPYVQDVILASNDMVAIDAIAAKLMGIDPMSIKFIRLAHEKGLGIGDPTQIEIVGDIEASKENWHFTGPFRKMTFASRMQHLIYWGPLKRPIEWSLRTILAPWSYIASIIYHDMYWYPMKAKKMMREILQNKWGQLFNNFEKNLSDENGFKEIVPSNRLTFKTGLQAFIKAFSILKTAVINSPEASKFRHH